MATNETVDITINSAQAVASLRNIERNIDLLTNGFKEFMTGVAEGMAGALASTKKADAGLQNMTKTVKGLNGEVSKVDIAKKLGQQTAQATKSVETLSKSVGSIGGKFTSLESIVGGFVLGNLIRDSYKAANEMRGFSEANLSAGFAVDSVNRNMTNLRTALIESLKPLNDLIASIDISVAAFKKLFDIALIVGSFFIGGAIARGLAVVASRLAASETAAFKYADIIGKLGERTRAYTDRLIGMQRAQQLARAGAYMLGSTTNEAGKHVIKFATGPLAAVANFISSKFTPAMSALANKLSTNNVLFGLLAATYAKFFSEINSIISAFGDAIVSLGNIIGIGLERVFGGAYRSIKQFLSNTLKDTRDAATNIVMELVRAGMLRGAPGTPGTAKQSGPMGRSYSAQDVKNMEDDINKLAQLRLQLSRTAELDLLHTQQQNRNTLEQLALQTKLVGKAEDYSERQKMILDMQQRQRSVVEALQDKLSNPEIDARAKDIIRQQIADYKKMQSAADAAQLSQLQKLQNAKLLEQDRLNTLQNITQEIERQQRISEAISGALGGAGAAGMRSDLLFERSLMGRSALDRSVMTQRRELRNWYNQQIGAITEAFSAEDGITDAKKYAEAVAQVTSAFDELNGMINRNVRISSEWSTGWNEAVTDYLDNVKNMADVAREVFGNVMRSMEDALENFVKTGKLSFKDLVRSIIVDLTSIALRQAFRNLFSALSIAGGGGWLSSLGSFLGSTIGASGGYTGPASIGNRATAATVNNYYISAVDSRSVAQFFAENRRTALGAVEQARKEMPIRGRF